MGKTNQTRLISYSHRHSSAPRGASANAALERALQRSQRRNPEHRIPSAIRDLNEHLRQNQTAGDHHKPTGLIQDDDPDSFRYTSEIIAAVRNDPAYQEDLQVLIDLDDTMFPLHQAIAAMGIDLSEGTTGWTEGPNCLSSKICTQYFQRPDLSGTELSEQQLAERNELVKKFFSDLHSQPELMTEVGVFEHGPQIVQALRAQGVKIHVFTHRDPAAREATELWLKAMGIPYDQLIVVDHDHPESDKAEYCEKHGIPILIDDKPATIANGEARNIEAIALGWEFNVETIESSGGDEAQCWREIGHLAIGHLEQAVLRRRAELRGDVTIA